MNKYEMDLWQSKLEDALERAEKALGRDLTKKEHEDIADSLEDSQEGCYE